MQQNPYYGVQLLDDLHNFFPDLLYMPSRFHTVQDVLQYIRQVTQDRFNLFSRGQTHHLNQQLSRQQQQQNRAQARATTGQQQVAGFTVDVPIYTQPSAVSPLLNMILGLGSGNRTVSPTNITLESLLGLGLNLDGIDMEPVPIIPTQAELERATELIAANNSHEAQTCSICQDCFASGQGIRRIRHCNHEFHRSCIDVWFQGHADCPICRHDIREQSQRTASTNRQPSRSS